MTMNFQKNVLSVLLVLLVSVSTMTASSDPKVAPSWKSQIANYLADLNLNEHTDIKSVKIDFIIIDGGEIVVLSTSEKALETTIKERLNYKVIAEDTFEKYTKYTLPIVFDMK